MMKYSPTAYCTLHICLTLLPVIHTEKTKFSGITALVLWAVGTWTASESGPDDYYWVWLHFKDPLVPSWQVFPSHWLIDYYTVCSALEPLRGSINVSAGSSVMSTVLKYETVEIRNEWLCSDVCCLELWWASSGFLLAASLTVWV